MTKRKTVSFLIALLLLVNSMQPVRAEAYTVSGNTATAIEGTTSWTPSGGVGSATVDLKNGTLEWSGVQITTNSLGNKHSSKTASSDVTHDGWTINTTKNVGPVIFTAEGVEQYNFTLVNNISGSKTRPSLVFDLDINTLKNYDGTDGTYYIRYTYINPDPLFMTTYYRYTDQTSANLIYTSVSNLGFNGRVPVYIVPGGNTVKLPWATNTKEWTASKDTEYDEIAAPLVLWNFGNSVNTAVSFYGYKAQHSRLGVNKPSFYNMIDITVDPERSAISLPGRVMDENGRFVNFTSCTIPDEVQKTFNVPQVSNVIGAKQINDITLKNCSSNGQTFG